MSLTLGEKLRQAREERGFSLSEVADQTRISGQYLESIENDDYSRLPGGIFNKGFVKSYAKFVGVNEQEALADYTSLMSRSELSDAPELKLYKPEVLTDDRSGSSMIPTVITAVVILGLMTAGILFLVDYLRRPADVPVANTSAANASGANSDQAADNKPEAAPGSPEMGSVKIEFKTVNQPVRLIATLDGTKSDNVIAAGGSSTFEPKESLTLNYNRWNAGAVQLLINSKVISLPAEPLKGAADKGRIEFTITKDNLAQIWSSGSITTEVPAVAQSETESNVNTAGTPAPAPSQSRTNAATSNTAVNKPVSNTAANTVPRPSPEASRPAKTPVPSTPAPKPSAKPAGNTEY